MGTELREYVASLHQKKHSKLALGMEKGAEFVRSRPEIEHACLIGRNGDIRLF